MLKRLLACMVMLTAVTVEAAGQAAIKAAQRCARQMEAAGQTAIKTAKCARQNVVGRTCEVMQRCRNQCQKAVNAINKSKNTNFLDAGIRMGRESLENLKRMDTAEIAYWKNLSDMRSDMVNKLINVYKEVNPKVDVAPIALSLTFIGTAALLIVDALVDEIISNPYTTSAQKQQQIEAVIKEAQTSAKPDFASLKRQWLREKQPVYCEKPDFAGLKKQWTTTPAQKQQLQQALNDISTYGSGTASPKLNELKKGWCPKPQQQRFQKAFAEKQARLDYLRNTLANRENLQKEVVGCIREYNDMGAKLREKHTEQYRNRPPFSYDEHEESYFERALNWLNQKQGKEKRPDVVEQVSRDWRKMDDDLQVHRNKQAEMETVQEAEALSELNKALERMKQELKANTFDLEDAQ